MGLGGVVGWEVHDGNQWTALVAGGPVTVSPPGGLPSSVSRLGGWLAVGIVPGVSGGVVDEWE